MFAVVFAGIAPGIALLCFFYLKDQYNNEPIGMVLRTFIFGALLVLPVMALQYAFHEEGFLLSPFGSSFIATGLFEEFFKWFVLFFTAYKHVEFNQHYDGIVYGVSVSLGFATVENIFYLLAFGVDHALLRALLPVSSHALFGVTAGYYLGLAKFCGTNKKKYWILLSLILPWLFHSAYNYILFIEVYWSYIMLPFLVFLWWISLRKVKIANEQQPIIIKKMSSVKEII